MSRDTDFDPKSSGNRVQKAEKMLYVRGVTASKRAIPPVLMVRVNHLNRVR